MLTAGIGQGVDEAPQLVQRQVAPGVAGVHRRVAADAVQVAMVGDMQVRRLQRRGHSGRGRRGCSRSGIPSPDAFRTFDAFHAFPQCYVVGLHIFHDKAATAQMGGQIRIHRSDLCLGHVLGEHAVAHGGAFGSQADNIASRGVADHGDGKGSVLHYVRAEPHCTLLCASWDSAVSMRQTQDLECRI